MPTSSQGGCAPGLWPLVAASSLAAALAEVLLLPHLATMPLYLALTLATTIVAAASIGARRSGVRGTLPRPLRIGSTVLLGGLSLATILVLVVLPYLGSTTVRHDAAVSFAVPAVASPQPAAPAGSEPPAAAPGVVAAVPIAVSGRFNHGAGPDTVSGMATLGRTEEGLNVLRLTGLDATPGPDLYLYLSTVDSPGASQAAGGVLVSPLKTYRGEFTFTLDPSLDLSRFRSVAVYCRSFEVVFGYANLR